MVQSFAKTMDPKSLDYFEIEGIEEFSESQSNVIVEEAKNYSQTSVSVKTKNLEDSDDEDYD